MATKKDVLIDVSFQTGRNALHEVFHLILLGLVFVDRHKILTNIILNVVRNVQTVHSRVRII